MAMLSESTINRYFEFRGAIEAVRLLRREIGVRALLPMLVKLEARHLRGEPFHDVGEPVDEKERLSRRQVGQVILLYQLLKEKVGEERAFEIARKLVKAVAIEFLAHALPTLRRAEYVHLDQAARDAKAAEIVRPIVNAESDIAVVGLERVDFTVTKCWFHELTVRAGVPELARMFCAGDEGYFETHQPEIRYTRTTTLAEGGPCCDFKFHWIEAEKKA